MIEQPHRRAESLAAEAALALTENRKDEAVALYREAAAFEQAAFETTPNEKERTKSILAVSLTSLLYKARQYDEAERTIFRLLALQELTPWANEQLRELLEVVTDERLIQKTIGRQYSGDVLTLSLRGGEIGAGTGPFDVILDKVSAFRNLLYRVAEYVGEFPFRSRGAPPQELINLLQVRTTQPGLGSFRFEIKLTEPLQRELFEKPVIKPSAISDTLFRFLETLNSGTRAALEEAVPNKEYRTALLKLVRNAAPSGKRVEEIGLYRKKGGDAEAVYLNKTTPDRIRRALPPKRKAPGQEPAELMGVLRALHLDENWLEITLPRNQSEKCDTVPEMLDDVVGPMVNHEVVVKGIRRTKRGGARRLLVEDIELTDPD